MIADSPPSNASEWSVSDLAGALKRTLEDSFGHVRVRGEISGFRGQHSSGHAYFSLKDQNARLDAVIWKGTYGRLRIKPEEGLEVIATGRITTFPGKSTYQIVVDSLEPAGIGALMALLEERRRKLTAEGLFETARKRPLPYLPRVIGVVTSPTGAVIRDILHRLEDRFPVHVLVWPVRVQGETSAAEVTAAIRGFNALSADGAIPRPDVLIVARGGGSIEDLWGFNEEIVVRAAAESAIPLVAAVGHETDWTLIDHAADRRAPTPTGAAEMVVPVRVDLLAGVNDLARRHAESVLRMLDRRKTDLRSVARGLPGPDALFAAKRQKLDLAATKLAPALARNARDHEIRLRDVSGRLAAFSPAARLAGLRARLDGIGTRPQDAVGRLIDHRTGRLAELATRLAAGRAVVVRAEIGRIAQQRETVLRLTERLVPALSGQLARKRTRYGSSAQLFDSLNYKSVLARGFAIVRDADGRMLRQASAVTDGQALVLEFVDGTAEATGGRGTKPKGGAKTRTPPAAQGALF
ncbi:exodeoxyribonuclease VII large subunit [Microvirga antarctica]|uniref:exodeoxyribonuclease VII large subunit n=1 Tax=Microvirga antarctica TaxID=2819233 RepID=UPI001B314C59|nr:exodeoxyribonuclease VII large subunit [Microvirga antarctica]